MWAPGHRVSSLATTEDQLSLPPQGVGLYVLPSRRPDRGSTSCSGLQCTVVFLQVSTGAESHSSPGQTCLDRQLSEVIKTK